MDSVRKPWGIDIRYNISSKVMKRSLNSDRQQSHQYKQNKQSPLIISLNTKRPRHVAQEMKVLARDRHKYLYMYNTFESVFCCFLRDGSNTYLALRVCCWRISHSIQIKDNFLQLFMSNRLLVLIVDML